MFATEHERERGPRPGLVVTDVASVMYGCQVSAMLSCHVSRVTQLVTGLQTPDRDLHCRHRAQSAARANNHKMTWGDGGRRKMT